MIILNMIVKNEGHCIERCLRSVKPFIDEAVIVDTGSTDSTHNKIQAVLGIDFPWEYHCKPWVNFGVNRDQALDLAKERSQFHDGKHYAFFMDADEEFRPESGFWWPVLTAPVVGIWNTTPRGGRYLRSQLVDLGYDFHWQGVVHEELVCEQPGIKGQILEGCTTHGHYDSHRNKDVRQKLINDVKLLSSAPATPRNTFYLAKTYQELGLLDRAKVTYRQRINQGGFEEEVWYSLFMVASILEAQDRPPADVVGAYVKAYLFRPARAETLRALAEYQKRIGNLEQYHLNTQIADQMPMTTDVLFVDPSAYQPIIA